MVESSYLNFMDRFRYRLEIVTLKITVILYLIAIAVMLNSFDHLSYRIILCLSYRHFGSLQLLLSLKIGTTISSPQIFFPARFGFLIKA